MKNYNIKNLMIIEDERKFSLRRFTSSDQLIFTRQRGFDKIVPTVIIN